MKLLSKWEDIDIEEAKATLENAGIDEKELYTCSEENFYWRTDYLDFNTIEYLKHKRNEQAREKDFLSKKDVINELYKVIEHLENSNNYYHNWNFASMFYNGNDYKDFDLSINTEKLNKGAFLESVTIKFK